MSLAQPDQKIHWRTACCLLALIVVVHTSLHLNATSDAVNAGILTKREQPSLKTKRVVTSEGQHAYQEGLAYFEQKEYHRAVQAFAEALSQGFQTSEVSYFRGKSYYGLKRYDEALADLSKVIQMDPANPYGYLLRASILEGLGRTRDAVEDLTKGITISPNPIAGELYGARGVEYLRLREPEKARQDFTRALDFGFSKHVVYSNRGRALMELGRFEEAIRDFSSALTKKQDHYDSLIDRGWIYGCLGKFQKGLEDFDRILSKKPDDSEVRSLRGWVRLELDDVEGGLSDLTYAAAHGSRDPWLYINLAYAFYKRGEIDKALQANEKGLALRDGQLTASLHFQRGAFLLVKGRYDDGREAYEQGRAAAQKASDRFELEDAVEDLRETIAHHTQIKKDVVLAIMTRLEEALNGIPPHTTPGIKRCQLPGQ